MCYTNLCVTVGKSVNPGTPTKKAFTFVEAFFNFIP